ncbi:MAG: hypothetical protein JXR70_15730 [Spirochaetales bacterium]|nr:hypothetical protein [Spirochaetales bacterium]
MFIAIIKNYFYLFLISIFVLCSCEIGSNKFTGEYVINRIVYQEADGSLFTVKTKLDGMKVIIQDSSIYINDKKVFSGLNKIKTGATYSDYLYPTASKDISAIPITELKLIPGKDKVISYFFNDYLKAYPCLTSVGPLLFQYNNNLLVDVSIDPQQFYESIDYDKRFFLELYKNSET